jgi:REP element-mobilizing transposase RayT
MPQSFASVYLHIVYSTKKREPFITTELRTKLYAYLRTTAQGTGTKLLDIGGMPDHVHLLLSFGREVTIAEAVKTIKGASSRWVHDKFPHLPFEWQAGYGSFSVGFPELPALRVYIANQETHHTSVTFQDEYRELLSRHGLEWDEKYVWD